MRFEAINPGPALTLDEIDEYAAANALSIPASVKQQLLEQNGGAFRVEVLIEVEGRDEAVSSLFGVGMRDVSSELAWIAETFRGRLPDGLLAIADDPGGNLYAVETSADGRVWFWDHEREGDESALSPVAPSFDAFLDSLRWQPA